MSMLGGITLAACGGTSPESVLQDMQEALSEVDSMSTSLETDVQADDYSEYMRMDVDQTLDPFALEGTITIEEPAAGELVIDYVHVDGTNYYGMEGFWEEETGESPETDLEPDFDGVFIVHEDVELEETDDTYVLTYQAEDEEAQEFVEEVFSGPNVLGEDVSDITGDDIHFVDFELVIDAETNLPISDTVRIEAYDNEFDLEDYEMTIETTYSNFNEIDEIEAPQ